MKKRVLNLLAVLVLSLLAEATMAQTFSYPVKGKQGFSLIEKTRDGFRVNYEIGEFTLSQINYRGEEMSEISINGLTLPNNAGCPNLPVESRLMAIPQGAKATLSVVRANQEVIHNVNIAPALRIQAEDEEPDMNYVKDLSIYNKNAFYPAEPFMMGDSYIRGVDAVTVAITPFQYNPVTKDLIVYTSIELSVRYEGGNGHFGDDRLRSPYWDPILATELMNYDQLPVIDYQARMQQWLRDGDEGAEYLIITPNNDAWAEYANQLRDYRMRQGIITKVYRLDEMPANSTSQMKSWFHNAYNNWDIAPVAVCLLGDHGTNMGQYIPAEVVSHPSDGNCITDNRYADPSGDNLPDMVFSRLIAQNANELPVMVGKQIEYEYGNPNMDPNFYTRPITALGWQTERWFQICSEVFGGYMRTKGYDPNRINCIYQGTPGSVWSSNQNTSMVVNYFGPNGVGYIPQSPTELGGWTGGTPQQVVDAVNQGTFWVQHRDHGLETGWGEPAVRNSHVNQMNNVGKMPFVMSINCSTGRFDYSSDCFCEAWMRRLYNGQNAGAVGVLCPTQVSYSFVNDTYVWGVYDLFDGEFMPTYGPYALNTGNWMPAFGNVAGKYFLAQSSWPYNGNSKDITYTMFTAHCDAFLRIYTQVPQEMAVSHPEVVIAGHDNIPVSAPEGCMISLVKENAEGGWDILAVVQATGSTQNIAIEPQMPPTEIHLIATGQNYLRYEAVIGVIPDAGPYIIFDNNVIHDENGNGQLDYGETINLDVTLRNVGGETMESFEAVLATTSEYISINNSNAQYSSIAPNSTQTLDNAFSFTVAENVPDNTSHLFTITVNHGNNQFVSKLNLKSYAPVLRLTTMSITEINGNGNGRLDPGETARVSFPLDNKGHSDAGNTLVELSLQSPYITVEESTVAIGGIQPGETAHAIFVFTVNPDTPIGYSCPFSVNATCGQYNVSKDFAAKVGAVIEDFETGTIGQGWNNGSSNAWRIDTQDPYEGLYCIRSGNIGNNANTSISFSHEAGVNDTISFYYAVSSEASYDKLHFYVDNTERGVWSGEVTWTRASFPVTAGNHTYTWTYTKDVSAVSGQDCAWIDFVSLPTPRIMAGTAGDDVTICEGEQAHVVGYAVNYNQLSWTTSGDGSFLNANTPAPTYNPGVQDIANGGATLTISLTNGQQTITDNMVLTINKMVEIENAIPNPQYCAIAEPQEIGVTLTGEYTSFEWTTQGDGTFGNPNEPMTTYTPGMQDIENGSVVLKAEAEAESCGSNSIMISFEMAPAIIIENAIAEAQYCATVEPQEIGVTLTGDYVSFGWTTVGDGTFGNPNEPMTTYTPGAQDIASGVVMLSAVAETQNCGGTAIEIPFEMNPAPYFNVALPNCYLNICQGQDLTLGFEATGFINGEMTIELDGEEYHLEETATSIVIPAADLEPGEYQVMFRNPNNGVCSASMEVPVVFNVVKTPELTVETTQFTICEGETVQFELNALGGVGEYLVSGTGIEPIQFTGGSHVLELTPAESTEIHLTRIESMDMAGCFGNCFNELDITLSVEVTPAVEVPEVTGDTDLDAYLTPTSEYRVTNDVAVEFVMEPSEAGTLVPANDNKSAVISWNQNYRGGRVTLNVTPTAECNHGGNSMEILVKNSTAVGEGMNVPSVYPNPTSDKINIQGVDMTRVAIYSTLGQLMYEASVNGSETSVEVGQFPAGTYIVKVTCGDKASFTQLINIVK